MYLHSSRFAVLVSVLLATSQPVWAADGEARPGCPLVPPTNHQVEIGYGRGNQAEALAAARAQATQRMTDRLCQGLSASRCDEVRRHILPWSEDWDPKKKSACALAAIPTAWVDTLARDNQALASHLESMGDDLASRLGNLPIRLEAPTWTSGCVAGEVGAPVRALLITSLAQKHPGVSLAEDQADPNSVASLRTSLAPMGGQVALQASWKKPGEAAWSPLPGFTFPADLFGIKDGEVGACRSNDALGLEQGERRGVGDLSVRLDVGRNEGSVCEGTTLNPRVSVNRPARVRVYSVARDGRGFLVWPPPGASDHVAGTAELGPMETVSVPGMGDERLVAVAVAEGGNFGASDGWRPFCAVPGGFGPSLYPAGAGVGTVTFTVQTGGACAPTPASADLARQTQAAIDAAPVCQ